MSKASRPILMLETGFHTSKITCVNAARDGTILTVSEDATARVWHRQGANFVLERVLRVPYARRRTGETDKLDDGTLKAGAISADGRWIAVGGWTGWKWLGGCVVYLFERDSGRLAGRLGPLPAPINHLCWREDGALAVCIEEVEEFEGYKGGLSVYRWPGGQLLWRDEAACSKACWLPDGGLVCYGDTFLHRYSREGQVMSRLKTRAGDKYKYTDIDHDGAGTLLASLSTPAVARVRLTARGGFEKEPPLDMGTMPHVNLGAVVWAAGQWWAGGYDRSDSDRVVLLRWSDLNRPPHPVPALQCKATSLAPASDGGLLVGTADARPQLLQLDAEGRVLARQQAAIPDFREQQKVLAVNNDARRVRVGLHSGADPVVLDLAEGRLTAPHSRCWKRTTTCPAEEEYVDEVGGDGSLLGLVEAVLAFADTPDGKHRVLGCNLSLRLRFLRAPDDDAWVWARRVPDRAAGARAVVVSGDGKSVVVAYGNGTLGWHRMQDGKRYLSAFIHPEDQRWIAWTPSGYYWASPGAEELLGWHVNHGVDQAPDFIPVSQMRDRYARPAVVQAILETYDEAKALAKVGQH